MGIKKVSFVRRAQRANWLRYMNEPIHRRPHVGYLTLVCITIWPRQTGIDTSGSVQQGGQFQWSQYARGKPGFTPYW